MPRKLANYCACLEDTRVSVHIFKSVSFLVVEGEERQTNYSE